MRPFLSFFVCALVFVSARAQITTDNSLTPEELVALLVGPDVPVSNIAFTGTDIQRGSFVNNNGNLTIDEGIVLSTGNIALMTGPNTTGSAGENVGGGGYPDLTTLGEQNTYDAAVLEFDFIATGDSLSFNFCFGSEEYNEWVNSGFNDVFGLFLDGPGISGTFQNSGINLATVPDTDGIPISINSINNILNWDYYINNDSNADPNATEMDGFTVTMTASSILQCGETYHIRLCIADGGDGIIDSVILLEAGSFSSVNPCILGCTDINACNFNPEATTENGSCLNQIIVENVAVTACDFYEWEGLTLTESGVYSVSNLESIGGLTYGGQFQDSHYFITIDAMEWSEGVAEADSLSGSLCVFNSEEELSFVITALAQHFTPASQTNGVQEGAWVGLYDQQWIDGDSGISHPCVHFDGDGPFGMLNLNDSAFQGGASTPCFSDEQEIWHNLVALIEIPSINLCEELSILDLTLLRCEDVQTFCGPGTIWDAEMQMCIGDGSGDINLDGCVQLNDLLDLLSAYGNCAAEESAWMCGDPLEYQGYDYETVQIGEKCWFAENLRSENYENGEAIPVGLNDNLWVSTSSGAVAVYEENPSNVEVYGRLYNWFAVDDARGLCPSGWNVPTDGEWITMEVFLGMSEAEANGTSWRGTDQGTQMKKAEGWFDGGNGTNSSGLSGLPGGHRHDNDGNFLFAGNKGYWWSSTRESDSSDFAWGRLLASEETRSHRIKDKLNYGFSIRCIKDAE